jgi:hypothetical protein
MARYSLNVTLIFTHTMFDVPRSKGLTFVTNKLRHKETFAIQLAKCYLHKGSEVLHNLFSHVISRPIRGAGVILNSKFTDLPSFYLLELKTGVM